MALIGKIKRGPDGDISAKPNPLVSARASELLLNTDVMSALTASEFSACVRLPNEINRTIGSVRSFAEHYRSSSAKSRKRLLAFRQVQNRLANAVPREFLDLIRLSETGVRIVSDAHLEWLDVDGLPLSIRKNCSRVPVAPGNLFVDTLASKRIVHLSPQDFRSVLVISALERDDPIKGIFEHAYGVFEPQWRKSLTVTYASVSNEGELIKALNEFDGPMVVFDGHGGHSKDQPAVLSSAPKRSMFGRSVVALRECLRSSCSVRVIRTRRIGIMPQRLTAFCTLVHEQCLRRCFRWMLGRQRHLLPDWSIVSAILFRPPSRNSSRR